MKQALQLPPAVAAKLAKTSPSPTPVNTSNDSSAQRQDEEAQSKGISDNAEADATSKYVSIYPVVLSTV